MNVNKTGRLQLRVNSVLTEALNSDRQVVAHSKTSFKKGHKPKVDFKHDIFFKFEDEIKRHMKHDDNAVVKWFVVTISTTTGKFIQTYKQGCFQ